MAGKRTGSLEKPQDVVEIWKNTAYGMTWLKKLDKMGREVDFGVKGQETFTITVFDRQTNQMRTATPELDPFRNGRLILVREALETDLEEFAGPDSMTDAEIGGLILQAKGDAQYFVKELANINSLVTLNRIREELLIEGMDRSFVLKVDNRMREVDPAIPAESIVEG